MIGVGISASAAGLRQTINFNRDWVFLLGDKSGAEAVKFDEASWEHVGLPHSFSLPYFAATNAFYVGYGWYRKHFDIPTSLGSRQPSNLALSPILRDGEQQRFR